MFAFDPSGTRWFTTDVYRVPPAVRPGDGFTVEIEEDAFDWCDAQASNPAWSEVTFTWRATTGGRQRQVVKLPVLHPLF